MLVVVMPAVKGSRILVSTGRPEGAVVASVQRTLHDLGVGDYRRRRLNGELSHLLWFVEAVAAGATFEAIKTGLRKSRPGRVMTPSLTIESAEVFARWCVAVSVDDRSIDEWSLSLHSIRQEGPWVVVLDHFGAHENRTNRYTVTVTEVDGALPLLALVGMERISPAPSKNSVSQRVVQWMATMGRRRR